MNPRNVPRGKFETEALAAALDGQTTQTVRGGKLLTVVPLPFAVADCSLCHAYTEQGIPPGAIVGAISLEVPLSR